MAVYKLVKWWSTVKWQFTPVNHCFTKNNLKERCYLHIVQQSYEKNSCKPEIKYFTSVNCWFSLVNHCFTVNCQFTLVNCCFTVNCHFTVIHQFTLVNCHFTVYCCFTVIHHSTLVNWPLYCNLPVYTCKLPLLHL